MKKSHLSKDVILLSLKNSIDETIRIISLNSKNTKYPGFAIVTDKELKVLGVITDGDIRRAYVKGVDFRNSVSSIMKKNPILIFDNLEKGNYLNEINRLLKLSEEHNSNWIRFIPIVDQEKKLLSVVDYFDLIKSGDTKFKKVVIFGMGYVGLTLAGVLANRGHKVTGIDSNESLIKRLNKNEIDIHEPGLKETIRLMKSKGRVSFNSLITNNSFKIHIIAVGTPINKSSLPDLKSLIQVLNSIGQILQKGDQVMLRSTVPLGTTRKVVIPVLEKKSSLEVGKDFHIAFTPERTIEGNAMQELYSLPQIVGGYSEECTKKAIDFWGGLTSTVVKVPSIEAAELVKLANNTFRDLSFAFSNNLSMLADKFNINTHELIIAANKGYSRNPIPLPSPGVGGYCLTKDPFLYDSSFEGVDTMVKFGKMSRISNEEASKYPLKILKKYSKKTSKKLTDFNVLIVGIAFKGIPETKDIRSSVSLELIKNIIPLVIKVYIWDAIVDKKVVEGIGYNYIDNIEKRFGELDAIIIMNNHIKNSEIDFNKFKNNHCLLFDGWSQYNPTEIEQIDGLTYSTMGYISP